MVKKIFLALILLMFVIFTNSCFIIYEAFVYDSDLDERRQEMNNKILVGSFASSLNTGSSGYSFIVFTDTHLEDGDDDGLEEKLTNAITLHSAKFAIILGDITGRGEGKDFNTYIEIAKKVDQENKIPFYPVLGNHDLIGNGWEHWKSKIGSTNYRIHDTAGNATLLILDSANLYYGKEQLDWLEKELKTANRDVFVFSHVPPFAPGYLQQLDAKERARMASILQNKCDIMFAGHTHVRYIQKTGNVEYISIESYRDDKTYCLVNVSNSGNITYEFKKF